METNEDMILPLNPDHSKDDSGLKKKNNILPDEVETREVDDKLIGDDFTIKQAEKPDANNKVNVLRGEENY